MKIIIPGGSGQVGTILARHFHKLGHDVVVLSRSPSVALLAGRASDGQSPSLARPANITQIAPWRTLPWDARTLGPWQTELDGADLVINLAGRSVNCRYSAANRYEMLASRVDSTRIVGESIACAKQPPRVWIQASTATIYAHRFDAPNDDIGGVIGGNEPNAPDTWRFSIEVATSWEKAFNEANTPHSRKVALRSAMTMSPDRGGVFDVLLWLVRRRLGGRAGDGRQFVSWIHDRDFLRAIDWLIERDDLSGPVNVCSPNPLPNAEFMAALRSAWGVRLGLSASEWMLAIGAWMMRTETELVLKSRRVTPTRLLQSGFAFEFPSWPDAARDLCERWKDLA